MRLKVRLNFSTKILFCSLRPSVGQVGRRCWYSIDRVDSNHRVVICPAEFRVTTTPGSGPPPGPRVAATPDGIVKFLGAGA